MSTFETLKEKISNKVHKQIEYVDAKHLALYGQFTDPNDDSSLDQRPRRKEKLCFFGIHNPDKGTITNISTGETQKVLHKIPMFGGQYTRMSDNILYESMGLWTSQDKDGNTRVHFDGVGVLITNRFCQLKLVNPSKEILAVIDAIDQGTQISRTTLNKAEKEFNTRLHNRIEKLNRQDISYRYDDNHYM